MPADPFLDTKSDRRFRFVFESDEQADCRVEVGNDLAQLESNSRRVFEEQGSRRPDPCIHPEPKRACMSTKSKL